MKHIRKFNEDISEYNSKLQSLEDGWLDGEGKVPSKDGISKLFNKMSRYPQNLPTPSIIPTPEGNVVLEWNKIKSMPSVDIDLETWIAEFGTLNHNEDQTFDLSDDSGWEEMFNHLSNTLMK